MADTGRADAKLPELEGLRGLLATWVLFGHWATTMPFGLGPLRQDLWNVRAVDVFMALSGFVIMRLRLARPEGYRSYLLRRFLRLYPAYLAVLALSVPVLSYVQVVVEAAPPSAMRATRLAILAAAGERFWPDLLLHLGMLHGLVPPGVAPHAAYAFVGQAWSISLEWQFYVLAPLLLPVLLALPVGRQQARDPIPPLLVAAGAVATLALVAASRPMGPAYLGSKLHVFALGAISFLVWDARARAGRFLPAWPCRAALLAVLGTTIALRSDQLLGLACWAVVLHCLLVDGAAERLVRRLLRNRLVLSLGRSSYSLYLVHFLVLVVAVDVAGRAIPGGIATSAGAALSLLATFVGSVLAASAMYRWIEQPFVVLGTRLVRARRTYPDRTAARAT